MWDGGRSRGWRGEGGDRGETQGWGWQRATVNGVVFNEPWGRHVLAVLLCHSVSCCTQAAAQQKDGRHTAERSSALMYPRLMFNESSIFRQVHAKKKNNNLKMALLCCFDGRCVCRHMCRLVRLHFGAASVCVSGQCLQESAVSWTSVSINVFLLGVHKCRFTNRHCVLTHHCSPWGPSAFVTSSLPAPAWSLIALTFLITERESCSSACMSINQQYLHAQCIKGTAHMVSSVDWLIGTPISDLFISCFCLCLSKNAPKNACLTFFFDYPWPTLTEMNIKSEK